MRSTLLALLLAVAPEAIAVETEPTEVPGILVDRWTVDDGLPLDHVTDLAQTPEGFLWLTTFDGLVRFDGLAFRTFRRGELPGLPSNRLTQIEVADDGALWLLTQHEEIVRVDGRDVQTWPAGSAGGLELQRLGDALLVHTRAGPQVVDGDTLRPWRGGLLAEPSRAVVLDDDGGVWIAIDDGRMHHHAPDGTGRTLGPAEGLPPRDDYPRGLARLGPGRVVFANGNGTHVGGLDGFHTVSPIGGVLHKFPFLHTLDDGGLLVPAHEGFLVLDDQETLRPWTDTGPADAARWFVHPEAVHRGRERVLHVPQGIRTQWIDPRGHVWVATNGDGLLRFRGATVETVGEREGAPIGSVIAVATGGDGTTWLATLGAGVLGLREGRSSHLEDVAPQRALDPSSAPGMTVDLDGRVWVRSTAGACLLRWDQPCDFDAAPFLAPEDLLGLHQAPDGRWWVATVDGLTVYAPSGRELAFLPYPLDATVHRITNLRDGPDGSVLLATSGAGLLRAGADGALEALGTAQGFPSDHLRGLLVDPDGTVWVGTEDAGLCRVTLAGTAALADAPRACVDRRHGLHDDGLHAIAPDTQGRLWMNTNRGVFAVSREALDDVLDGDADWVDSTVLDEGDGMADQEGNGGFQGAWTRDADGRLWFPTQDGAAIVDPERVVPAPAPAMALERLAVEGRDVPLEGGTVVLDPDQRDLDVVWTAIAFSRPEQVLFRHRLAGYDDAWQGPAAKRTARWTNLPPGEHHLEVQAGLGGAWTAPERLLTVVRRPAFHETRGFPASIAFFTALVGGFAVLGRDRIQRQRQRQLEALVDQRTQELQDRNLQLQEQTQRLRERGASLARTNALVEEQAERLRNRNAQVRAQAERLAEVDALKSRFVANLSHELRTPLTLVAGPLEDLARDVQTGVRHGTLDPDAARRLEVVLRNSERLQVLVEQLFDTARLDAGGIPLRARAVDLGGFARQLAERFRPTAERQGRVLQVHLAPLAVVVWADPDLLDKIVGNLLGNALKFTPAGGRITLTVEGDAHSARLTVTDTGPGVPPALRDRLFERYVQGSAGDDRRHEGAGIGLSLARELAELHGGELSLDGTHERGARFVLRLPRGSAHLDPEEIDLSGGGADPGSDFPDPDPEAPRVLVVEDHPDMRAYLAEHLSTRFRVRVARDGGEALARLDEGPVDAVVSDVMMPGMDGLALARALRAREGGEALPIVLVSAKGTDADQEAGLRVADAYVAKPFRMRDLLDRVSALLGTADTPEPEPEPDDEDAAEAPRRAVDAALLQRLTDRVHAGLGDPSLSVPDLARTAALSPRQLRRALRRLTGQAPSEWIRGVRLDHARGLLARGEVATVGEAAASVGMSRSYFSRVYRAWHGHPPATDQPSSKEDGSGSDT